MRIHRFQRGIALVLVLWVLALLTIIATGLTSTQRTDTALANNQVANAGFRAAAEAAIAYTALVLSMPPLEVPDPAIPAWLPNGAPHPWRFGGLDLEIRIFNEASRIDLNLASPETLGILLSLQGVDVDTAAAIADAIVDWRDEDDLRLLQGAEDSDYESAGRAIGAKDAPFVIAEELLQVLGMTPEIYRMLVDVVSVDAMGMVFDQQFASAAVIAAVQGIPMQDAEALVAARDAPLFEADAEQQFAGRGGPLYRIQVKEISASGGGRQMEVLIELMPGMSTPYQLRWRRLGRFGAPVTDSRAG